MYFMYVDESGDPGLHSPTSFFVLSGLVIHHTDWRSYYYKIKKFRKKLKKEYGINLYSEIHTNEIWRTGLSQNLTIARRIDLFNDLLWFIRHSSELKIITISANKNTYNGKDGILGTAWKFLIQRYENFLNSQNEEGLIFNDEGYERFVSTIVRKMTVYNPIRTHFGTGYNNQPIKQIIEDPITRQSSRSYFIQLADICCYFCRLRNDAGKKQKRFQLHKKFRILKPRYLLEASKKENYGFVYIK